MGPETDMPPNWRKGMRLRYLFPRLADRVALGVIIALIFGCLGFFLVLFSLRNPPVWNVPIGRDTEVGRVLDGEYPVRAWSADEAVQKVQRLGVAVRLGEPINCISDGCSQPAASGPESTRAADEAARVRHEQHYNHTPGRGG